MRGYQSQPPAPRTKNQRVVQTPLLGWLNADAARVKQEVAEVDHGTHKMRWLLIPRIVLFSDPSYRDISASESFSVLKALNLTQIHKSRS